MRERLKASPHPDLVKYITQPSLEREVGRTFDNIMSINLAHALMLHKQGIVDRESTQKLLAGMLDLIDKGPSVLPMSAEYEDIYYNIETYLIRALGIEVAGKLHTARSRNDLAVAFNRMNVRDAVLNLYPFLLNLRKTLLRMADEHKDTILTGYTHMQPAQPMTLGYYLAAVAEALERDFERISQCYARLNLSALGGCAFAGTGFDIDRFYTAELLGFDGPMENNMDAVASRDWLLELGAEFAILGSTINRFTHDLYYWGTQEFGYLEVDNTLASSSSIMPQKKNPTTFEHVKAKTSHLAAGFMNMIMVLKGIPFGHNKDMIETMAPFWNSVSELETILVLLNTTLSTLHIHKDGMKDRADRNYCTATELSDELVKTEGLSFRVAYQIVGSIIGDIFDDGKSILDITPEMLDKAGQEFAGRAFGWSQERIHAALDSAYSVSNKECFGAPGPKSMQHMIKVMNEHLEADQQFYAGLVKHQEDAAAQLQQEVKKVL